MFCKLSTTTLVRIKTVNQCVSLYLLFNQSNTNTASYLVLPTTINLLYGFHSKQFISYNPPMYLPSPIVNPAGGAAT